MGLIYLLVFLWSFLGVGFIVWISELGDLWDEFPAKKQWLLVFLSGPFMWMFVGLDTFLNECDKLAKRLAIGKKIKGWFMK